MTVNPLFAVNATTELTGLSFEALQLTVQQQLQTHDLQLLDTSDSSLRLKQPVLGQIALDVTQTGLRLELSAALPERIEALKTIVSKILSQHATDVTGEADNTVQALRWSDGAVQISRPPNLHFTTVQSITPVGSSFLRVRIKADDLSSFQDDSIHFRLLLPPADCHDPEWPMLTEAGATLWPKGDKALHRPAYTTRWIDQQRGEMDFDVFLHEGGRVTNWVLGAKVGDMLTIAGPGGGGIPQNSKVLIFADETAFPAVARILETLPEQAEGQATLVAAEGADCGYPISAPAGVTLTWLTRAEAGDLAERALTARQNNPEHFFWLASEKSDVTPVREAVKAEKPSPGTSYIAAYWSKP